MPEETPLNPDISLEVYAHRGMMGATHDFLPEAIIRAIAEWFAEPNEWANKYGTTVENAWFMMHPFCWCELDDCPWCREEDPMPNFYYKPLDFKVTWYKYIGRSMEYNKDLTYLELGSMFLSCLRSRE
jgi:hypothetical protein